MSDQLPPTTLQRLDPDGLGLPTRPVADAETIHGALMHASGVGCNLLCAPTAIQYLPPHYQAAIRVVRFPPPRLSQDPQGRSDGTWYLTDSGRAALHKSAIDALASAAGITDVHEACSVEVVDRHYWRATWVVRCRSLDGAWLYRRASREVDLREDSDTVQDMRATAAKRGRTADDQIRKARVNGAANAESKARNRAIRAALGLKAGYTAEEAARPFVFPVLLYLPPVDPEISRMQAAAELGIAAEVYGAGRSRRSTQPRIAAPLDPEAIVDVDPQAYPDDDEPDPRG